MMFEAAPALLAGQPLAILTVDITASVEDIREIRRYYLDVDGGRSGSPAVSVLDIVIRGAGERGRRAVPCMAGWARPGTAERAARQATGASGRTAREIQNRDTATLPETLIMAAEQVELVQPDGPGVEEVVADKGYHSDETLVALGAVGVRSHVSEPERGRRCWQDKKTGEMPPEKRAAQKALYANRRRVRGRRGRRLQRCRGEVVERSFAHLYETGGMRRVWVRGHENVRKRVLIQAAACNIGLLLRRLTGVGTPRSLQGRAVSAICRLIGRFGRPLGTSDARLGVPMDTDGARRLNRPPAPSPVRPIMPRPRSKGSATPVASPSRPSQPYSCWQSSETDVFRTVIELPHRRGLDRGYRSGRRGADVGVYAAAG